MGQGGGCALCSGRGPVGRGRGWLRGAATRRLFQLEVLGPWLCLSRRRQNAFDFPTSGSPACRLSCGVAKDAVPEPMVEFYLDFFHPHKVHSLSATKYQLDIAGASLNSSSSAQRAAAKHWPGSGKNPGWCRTMGGCKRRMRAIDNQIDQSLLTQNHICTLQADDRQQPEDAASCRVVLCGRQDNERPHVV